MIDSDDNVEHEKPPNVSEEELSRFDVIAEQKGGTAHWHEGPH